MTYDIMCVARDDGQWIARAVRGDTGDPFGIECLGVTADDARVRLEQWLAWQGEHAEALVALQQAERAYHRAIAGSAFAPSAEGRSALELQTESLRVVEAARRRLDDLRARKPEN